MFQVIHAVCGAFAHLFVTDVSLSCLYNRTQEPLYPPYPSQRQTSLQILLSNLNVRDETERNKTTGCQEVIQS